MKAGTLFCLALNLVCVVTLVAGTVRVGGGTSDTPDFATIAEGLAAARPGDTVLVQAGIYEEKIDPPRDGRWGAPIVLLGASGKERPLLYRPPEKDDYYLVELRRKHLVIDNFIIDGGFGARDVVKIRMGADSTVIRNCEIRNGTNDGVDISGSDWILIENCEIHHMLNGSYDDQKDSHGVTGGRMRHLVIRGCDIHHVTGDCFQADPGRHLNPHWDDILIEDCDLWTGPLERDAARWKKWEVPGENAIDTKVRKPGRNEEPESVAIDDSTTPRPRLVMRNVRAWGYTRGYIGNRSVFNLKEKVEVIMDRIVVHDSEVAFRLRGLHGGAEVTVTNCLVYNCEYAIRAEHGVRNVRFYNSTFGAGVANILVNSPQANGLGPGFRMENCLTVGPLPAEASQFKSNRRAGENWFINLRNHNYGLAPGSPAEAAGVPLGIVPQDLAGSPRPSNNPSLGAFEAAK